MQEEKVLEITVQVRKSYNLLGEILDLTQQMGEALDREDHTSFQIVLSMRREPLQELAVVKERIGLLLKEFPQEEEAYLRSILNGAEGREALGRQLGTQVQAGSRLWRQVKDLDEKISIQVAHDQSIYEEKL